MATGIIQVGDADGWAQRVALKEDGRLQRWMHFENADSKTVHISGWGVS